MDGVNVARADDRLEEVDSLLGAAGLPASDVRSAPARFDVVSGGGEAPGGGNRDGDDGSGVVGGLELSGTAGLFRSVAVREGAHGAGVGTVVCEQLEEKARAEGVEELYLLTTTAVDVFTQRGYERVERAVAPTAVRETTQFDERCPATATCMRNRL